MNGIPPDVTFVSLVFIVAISIGIFLSLILFLSHKGNTRANKYLSLLIFSFSVLQILDFLIQTRLLERFPHIMMAVNPLIFMLGPSMDFYVEALTRIHWKFRIRLVVHFIPAAAFYIFFLPVYLLDEQEKTRLISNAFFNHKYIIPPFFFIFAVVHILAYLIFSLRRMPEHTKNIKVTFIYRTRKSQLAAISAYHIYYALACICHTSVLSIEIHMEYKCISISSDDVYYRVFRI